MEPIENEYAELPEIDLVRLAAMNADFRFKWELHELTRKLEAAERDQKRLDWLSRLASIEDCSIYIVKIAGKGIHVSVCPLEYIEPPTSRTRPSFREALDEVMKLKGAL